MRQVELARALGISEAQVWRWENDLRTPKLETLRRIATILGASMDDLVAKPDAEPEADRINDTTP